LLQLLCHVFHLVPDINVNINRRALVSRYAPSSYDNHGSGSIVLEVQVALQNAGYDPGPTDGVFGPSTREAISRYQRDQGLDVTGSITDPVLQALGLD
ncbi:MAG: peptidoglycan-binding domain-containing protein, partial [Chthoniobacterales bacterium]